VSAATTTSEDTFSGTPLADAINAGRYSMLQTNAPPNTLEAVINGPSGGSTPLDVVIYQANGGQLFWLDVDNNSVWLGRLEQQGSLAGLPAARKRAAKTQAKINHSR
jgi:hypothetical protein